MTQLSRVLGAPCWVRCRSHCHASRRANSRRSGRGSKVCRESACAGARSWGRQIMTRTHDYEGFTREISVESDIQIGPSWHETVRTRTGYVAIARIFSGAEHRRGLPAFAFRRSGRPSLCIGGRCAHGGIVRREQECRRPVLPRSAWNWWAVSPARRPGLRCGRPWLFVPEWIRSGGDFPNVVSFPVTAVV